MRLRTTAGRYAGEIRDYSVGAGRAALRAGTAEPVEARAPAVSAAASPPENPKPRATLKPSTRRKG